MAPFRMMLHGIKKIATFDEDFKRVDFLEIFES